MCSHIMIILVAASPSLHPFDVFLLVSLLLLCYGLISNGINSMFVEVNVGILPVAIVRKFATS